MTTPWDFLRIATLYGIVWVAIVFAFGIYCLAFSKVWRNRHELSGLFNPFNENPFAGVVTTDIEIVTEPMQPHSLLTKPVHYNGDPESNTPRISDAKDDSGRTRFDPYSVNIEVGPLDEEEMRRPSGPELFHLPSLTRTAALSETNPDAWLYARVAFLFFCALLISWIPASINRLYSLAYPDRLIFGLNYAETIVLPLQGFWNCCVYIITSQTAVRNLFRSFRGQAELPRKNSYAKDMGGGLDSASGRRGGKGMAMGMGKVAAGLGVSGKPDNRLDVFANRRVSLRDKDGRQRLDSNASSVMDLSAAHLRS